MLRMPLCKPAHSKCRVRSLPCLSSWRSIDSVELYLADFNNFLAHRNMQEKIDSNIKSTFFGARKAAQKLHDEVIELVNLFGVPDDLR